MLSHSLFLKIRSLFMKAYKKAIPYFEKGRTGHNGAPELKYRFMT